MTRYRPSGGYGHRCKRVSHDDYDISWCWDAYRDGERCRFPRMITRETNRVGAERFCKKWDCKMPEHKP